MTAIVVAAVLAGLLASAGSPLLARLPEPEDPHPGKVTYAELAAAKGLVAWLAVGGLAYTAFAAWQLDRVDLVELIPPWVVVGAAAPLLAYVDWRTHLLPYRIVAPLFLSVWVTTLISAWWLGNRNVLLRALIGNAVVFVVFWLLHLIAARFFNGGFGYGDVRLSAVIGVVLGPLGVGATFWGIYAGFILGAIIGLVRARGRLRGGPPIAFGPFMLLGALAGLLVQ